MKLITIAVLAFSSTMLFADTPKPPEAPKPPVISDALKAQFYKAQAQMLQIQAQVDQLQKQVDEKRKAFTDAVTALQKACGDEFTLQGDAQGDPMCIATPKAPAPKKP